MASPPNCGPPHASPRSSSRSGGSTAIRITSPLGCVDGVSRPRSPDARPANATRTPSLDGWPGTGHASKKGPATGRQPAPDGRERSADGPPGATQLGLEGPASGAEAEGAASGEGLGGGGVVADALAGPTGAGLPDPGQ